MKQQKNRHRMQNMQKVSVFRWFGSKDPRHVLDGADPFNSMPGPYALAWCYFEHHWVSMPVSPSHH